MKNSSVYTKNYIRLNNKAEKNTVEDKVAQLFIVTPEELLGCMYPVVHFEKKFEACLSLYNIGGIVFFDGNIIEPTQIRNLITATQKYVLGKGGTPLFQSLDEEGGRIARIATNPKFKLNNIEPAIELGKMSVDTVFEKGKYIGGYLANIGFNLDFAPCGDVLTNPSNTVIADRSFGMESHTVGRLALSFAEGLINSGVVPTIKHFPGHGGTAEDSHLEAAFLDKTWEEIEACEMVPFCMAIKRGMPMIMIGHISLPRITGSDEPATLSRYIITEILRKKYKYDGLVITDSMRMKAITTKYSPGEAAVRAIEAGVDIILMPGDFRAACNGVLEAISSGRISVDRIETSYERIVRVKEKYIINKVWQII